MRTSSGWGIVAFVLGITASASAQAPIAALETPYTQDFDTLASTGTSSMLPTGWVFRETGTNANTTYGVSTGSSTTGDTLSFGAASATDRALGTLLSGSLVSTIGASFTNGTGVAVGSVSIAYFGEQWRVGSVGRVDRLDFQYSLNATSLSTGTWTDVDALDFVGPDELGPVTGTMGARVGNDATHRVAISSLLSVAIPAGATIWIRWNDLDATGADDGLGIDDFSLVAHGLVGPPVVAVDKSVTAPTPAGPTSILDYSIDVSVSSGQGVTSAIFTDTLPAGVTVSGATFTLDSTVAAPVTLTVAADGDAGEIVGGVVTVRLPDLAVGDIATVGLQVVVSPRGADGTITNTASVTCNGAVSGTGLTFASNTTSTDVVACVTTASGTIPLCLGDVLFDVFFDANGNGMHDAGEVGIGGWDIGLDGGAGSQMTASDGSATFAGLVAGQTYDVTGNTPPASAGTWFAPFPPGVFTTFGATRTYHVAVTCTCPDDGNACTALPVCDVGACGPTPPVSCDDLNPCTDDACTATGCASTPNTASCDDGSPSTRDDVCSVGACSGTAFTCTPGVCEASSIPNGVDCTISYASASASCGDPSSTDCDAPDHCSGVDGTCVAAVKPSTATCRASTGTCDPVETCDGTTTACPADVTTCMDTGPAVDAAVDVDAGTDAAVDVDAGLDAAVEADAGTDAAMTVDAGLDAGGDGGARDASAGLDGAVRVDAGTPAPPRNAGCGCRTSARGAPSVLWLGLVGLALLARRRRSRA